MSKKDTYKDFSKILNNPELRKAANRIVANIRFKNTNNDIKTLSVVSSAKNEGKTTVALSLAGAFANSGYRTILIDTDVYQHSLSNMLKNDNKASFYDVVCGNNLIEEAMFATEQQNLYFLDCSRSISSISDLLSLPAFDRLFGILRDNFDIIIFDTPPVLSCIDGSMISSICDGAIVVARQYKTKKDEVSQLAEQLDIANVKILGAVLNYSDKTEYRYYKY